MTRFAGLVCYGEQVETSPGIWETVEKQVVMKGDVMRQNSNNTNNGSINNDIKLSHRVSIIGDPYAFDNYFNIKWVYIDGRKWGVESVEIQRPRIIVSLGGLWNG